MRQLLLGCLIVLLAGCGFHLRGAVSLPSPLKSLYLQSNDPYGDLERQLRQFLTLSGVSIVATAKEAKTVLSILNNQETQQLVGISGTQRTRQYNLILKVTFQLTGSNGQIILPPVTISETRAFTIQSDQILAGSNEATVLYQQMRQAMAYDIMNQLGSHTVAALLVNNTDTPHS